jgi:Zn finger protein HypA/HybF involved in hydrogenase expression
MDVASDQVASARQKFNCPACGAEANWNPGKQALICPFCGTESPAQLKTAAGDTTIVEHDLAVALRSIPDTARGWKTATISVRCQSCQAITVFDGQQIGKRCDFCGSTALVPYRRGQAVPPRVAAAVEDLGIPGARSDSRGTAANGSRQMPSGSRPSRTPSRASIFRTGRSTHAPTRAGPPSRAPTITSAKVARTFEKSSGGLPPAS